VENTFHTENTRLPFKSIRNIKWHLVQLVTARQLYEQDKTDQVATILIKSVGVFTTADTGQVRSILTRDELSIFKSDGRTRTLQN
jgi:hypothetical protein